MLFTLFQIFFEFFFMQIILRQFKFKWLDAGLILVIVTLVEGILPVTSSWLPELGLLVIATYFRTHKWRVAIVVSIESNLVLMMVSQLTQLAVPFFSFNLAIPTIFVIITILISGLLYGVTKLFSLSIQSIGTLEAWMITLAFIIIISYLKLFNHDSPGLHVTLLGLGIVSAFGLIMITLQFERQRIVQQRIHLKQQKLELMSNRRYTQEMEQHYDELRRFRHDYQNVMLSLDEYLKTNDLAGLQHYYQKNLQPRTRQLAQSKYQLEDLARIKNKAVKSILFNKLNYAQSAGINVKLEVKDTIETFNMDSAALVVSLGIILDNAIEATIDNTQSWIHVAFIAENKLQVVIIKNSLVVPLPALWQLEQTGFSTKGPDRGLGLTNLQSIIAPIAQVSLSTEKKTDSFSQQLTIRLDD